MADIRPVIKAELDPAQPVREIMAVVETMLYHNPGMEDAILRGVREAVQVVIERRQKGVEKKDG